MFTAELLDGLTGKGCAKRWDSGRGSYLVDVPQVMRYVRQAVAARRAGIPRIDPEEAAAKIEVHTTQDPLVLREIQRDLVPEVSLSVGLRPDAIAQARPALQVRVEEYVHRRWRPAHPAIPLVASFKLQPRCYSLTAEACGYLQETVPFPCEVYAGQQETVWLKPSTDRGAPGSGPPDEPPPPQGGDADGATGTLRIHCDDPLLPFELARESGEVVSAGAGNATFQLPAGYFRIRPLASGTDNNITGPEWLVQVRRDTENTVRLPVMQALPSRLQPVLRQVIGEHPRGAQRWTSWFGMDSDPPVSSLLAYLADLRALDYVSFRDDFLTGARSPVLVLVAVDGNHEDEVLDFTRQLEVRFSGQDYRAGLRPPPFSPFAAPGLALSTAQIPPGAVTLRVGPKAGDAVDVRVPVLAGRPTALIWHVDQTGRLRVRIACPRPDGPPDYGRRIDLMQQLAALGQTRALLRVAAPLSGLGTTDPIADVITATALSHAPALARLPLTGRRLQPTPLAISTDDQVFRATRQELLGQGQVARARFRELADADTLPVTAAATRLLYAGLLRHARSSLRVGQLERVLRNQMPGSAWSAAWVEAASEHGLPSPPRTRSDPGPGVPAAAPERERSTVLAVAYA